jgi:hypothetical protein
VFSPLSDKVLMTAESSSKIISAEFYAKPSDVTSSVCEGSVMLISESGQLLQFGQENADNIARFQAISGKVSVRTVRELPATASTAIGLGAAGTGVSAAVVPNREIKSIYATLADTTSEHLPSVSDLYGKFHSFTIRHCPFQTFTLCLSLQIHL